MTDDVKRIIASKAPHWVSYGYFCGEPPSSQITNEFNNIKSDYTDNQT